MPWPVVQPAARYPPPPRAAMVASCARPSTPTLPYDVTDDGVQQLGDLRRRTGETTSSQRGTHSPMRAPRQASEKETPLLAPTSWGCVVHEGERSSVSITGLGAKCQVWALCTMISRWNRLAPLDVKWTEEMIRKLQRDLLKQSH
jgi:hypothetical protein